MSGGAWIWRVAFTLATLLLIYSSTSVLPSILHSPLTCTKVITESNTGSQTSKTTYSNLSTGTISLTARLREIESTLLFYSPDSHPLVVVKDISYGRYYALRDLQGWTLGYQNFSFEVIEQSFRTQVKVSDFSVFLCLGIHSQDRHCIKPSSLRLLLPTQRYNQIHGTRDILWRKDAYCYTMREALAMYRGSKNFTFPCWVLPKDREKLEAEMSRGNLTRDWIVKPCGQGEGHGIFIVNTYDEIETRPQNPDGFIVQPLLTDPFLVNGKKFDFRTYVLVTSMSPLRVYIYKEGLVRFASSKYNKNATRGGSEQQYLTNTSVGKKYTNLANLTWTFQKLKGYFESNGIDSRAVFESLNEAIVRTLLAAEFRYLRNFMQNLGGYDCHSCFQLLGVDVILDSKLGPKVIEVKELFFKSTLSVLRKFFPL